MRAEGNIRTLIWIRVCLHSQTKL